MRPLSLHGMRRTVGVREAAALIKTWTRATVDAGTETIVSVSELACSVPGCAPRETVVLLLRCDGPTLKLSIHKPLVEVTEEDVVSGWSRLNVPE